MSVPENHALRALLLHSLSEPEARALEERLMEEEGLLESLRDTENDLLDDYARGRLSDEERTRVERHLLATPESRSRLAVARSLARARGVSFSNESANAAGRIAAFPMRGGRDHRRRRTWQLALAAAACLAVVSVLVPSLFNAGDSEKSTELLLLADSARGASSQAIDMDSAATEVKLQVEVPVASQTSTYAVEIIDAAGGQVYEARGLRVREVSGYSVVDVTVPGRAFAAGPRVIVLRESSDAERSAAGVELFRWQIRVNHR